MSAASSHPGLSIAVKLIIATSIVVAATVAITSGYALKQAKETAAFEHDWRTDSIAAAAKFEARLLATNVAKSVEYMVAGSAYAEVEDVLGAALENQIHGDRARPQLTWFLLWAEPANPITAMEGLSDKIPAGGTPGPADLIYRSADAPSTAAEIIQLDRAFSQVPLAQRRDEIAQFDPNDTSYVLRVPVRSGNLILANLWAGVSIAAMRAELSKVSAEAQAHVQELRWKLWISAGLVLLVGIALAMLQAMSMARPIAALSEQATRIAQGDLDRRVPEGRRDELGTLAKNFNFMADRIGELLLEQAEKAALEHEMGLARSVQQAMLPSSGVESYGHVKVAGYCAPASSCGGDWWMHRKLSGSRVLIVIGDATGHGIHSAMIAATARGAVEALAALAVLEDKPLAPEQALRAIDSAIRNVGEHHVLMTAFAAVFDTDTGMLHYANAGQNFPYILRCGEGRTLKDAEILATAGNPLGDHEIKVEIRTGVRELARGDVFVCFTDGLVERANPAGQFFGDRRLLRILRGQPVEDARALDSLRLRVMNAVDAYAAGEDASDDVTFVLCQYDPPAMPMQLRRAGTA